MYKKNHTQLTIGENLLYQNLTDDILANPDRLINGLSATDPVPDHSTISRFRSDLQSMNL